MFETAPVSPSASAPAPPNSPASETSITTPVAATPEPVADQTAPADMEPVPKLRERLAWYSGAIVLTCILVFFGLRLDRVDPRAPFYYDLDSLLILPMVKATAERGPRALEERTNGVGVSGPTHRDALNYTTSRSSICCTSS